MGYGITTRRFRRPSKRGPNNYRTTFGTMRDHNRRFKRVAKTIPLNMTRRDMSKIYSYRQPTSVIAIQASAAATTSVPYAFILTAATNYSAFTDLYDQYRVDYLEYTFRPSFTATSLQDESATLLSAPIILTAVDKDSAAAITESAIREYQGCEIHDGNKTFTVRFKPGCLTGVWNGTNVVAGGRKISPWIDMAQNNIIHYGLNTVVPGIAGVTAAFQKWNVDLFVGLSFRNVR